MTPTERLQADWPKWEIGVFFTAWQHASWQWAAYPKGTTGFDLSGKDYSGCYALYKTERGACQSCRCALKAIRKAVT